MDRLFAGLAPILLVMDRLFTGLAPILLVIDRLFTGLAPIKTVSGLYPPATSDMDHIPCFIPPFHDSVNMLYSPGCCSYVPGASGNSDYCDSDSGPVNGR